MPQALVEPYAKHLSRVCKLPVRVATRAEELCLPGEVLLVPASRATWIGRSRLRLDKGSPSAMPFFRTLSQIYGSRAAGVVLRGEVVEGADALAALHDAGGKNLRRSHRSYPS